MHGVPSSLILRNESWVRQQAQSLMRRLPSNVEKADLIQVGLIGVAQAALSFVWDGNHETEEAKEAFVRFAQRRVKGAMLDELRQMDHLGRSQRRKVKVVQVARERWRASHGVEPTRAELSQLSGLGLEEVFALELAATSGQTASLSADPDSAAETPPPEPATEADEVEARVDTGILMRRLEKFFAGLPERERQVIDTYLGIGMTSTDLARTLNISPSRVAQLFKSVCDRLGVQMGHAGKRSIDRATGVAAASIDDLIDLREAELAQSPAAPGWGQLVEAVFVAPLATAAPGAGSGRIEVTSTTRWG